MYRIVLAILYITLLVNGKPDNEILQHSFIKKTDLAFYSDAANDLIHRDYGSKYGDNVVRRTQIAHECISNIDESIDCVPWSTLFDGQNQSELVTIPCEVCVTMNEFKSGEVLELQGGLDIIGMLVFPDGTKSTIRTPFIFVQGKLSMKATKVVNGDPDLRVVLYGTKDVIFNPHSTNSITVPGDGLDVGKKAIIVAGGQLDIQGLPDECPAWSRIERVEKVTPTPNIFLQQPIVPEECTMATIEGLLLHEKFSIGSNEWHGKGAPTELKTESNNFFIKVYSRNTSSEGPTFELPQTLKKCFLPKVRYLFSASLRLSKGDGSSLCSTEKTKCPVIKFSNTNYQINSFEAPVDGTWFTINGSMHYEESWLNLALTKSIMTISGPEAGVDIELDDFKIEIPPTAAFPDTSSVCSDLGTNGGADQVGGFAYPQTSYMSNTELKVKYEDDGNAYFHLQGRKEYYSTLTFDINPGCLPENSVYRVTSRVWIHSEEPVGSFIALKVTNIEGSETLIRFDILVQCPVSSEGIGWVTCEKDVTFDNRYILAKRIQFLIMTKNQDMSDVSYDDIHFNSVYGGEPDHLFFPLAVHQCWGNNSEVLVTSQTYNYDQEQIVTIQDVTDTGVVTFNEDFIRPLSVEESTDFAGEFALLSRNIVFEVEADDENNPLHGGYLMIYKTESDGFPQLVEGAAFHNFGQQGIQSRYPISFKESYDNKDTVISKNTIKNSYQRCINLYKTQNVHLIENVAYNTTGHCYTVEDDLSNSNVLTRNIGARTMAMLDVQSFESDEAASTFHIRTNDIEMTGNVAAGSEHTGFWFLLPPTTKNALKLFVDNVVHSNKFKGINTFPSGQSPNSISVLQNTKVYRNRGIGIYFNNGEKFEVNGGVFSDNRISIDVSYCDSILIRNIKVVGYSDDYQEHDKKSKQNRHCYADSEAVYGVRIHPNSKNTRMEGSKLQNIEFSNFNDEIGCKGNKAIYMSNKKYFNLTIDSEYIFEGLKFDEEVSLPISQNLMSFCEIKSAGIGDNHFKDLYIADDGSLNPEGTEFGFIVHDHPDMTSSAEHCVHLGGTCTQYCTGPGSCMSKVTIGINAQLSENIKLVVTIGEEISLIVEGVLTVGDFVGNVGSHNNIQVDSRRYYWFYLPAGDYTGKFVVNGEIIWPTFSEIMIDHPFSLNCPGHLFNFNLITPVVAPDTCDDLVIYGNFDEGYIGENLWYYDTGGMQLVAGTTGNGLSTSGRSNDNDGLSQFIDTRCMKNGMHYEIEAKVKLGSDAVCDPNYPDEVGSRCLRAGIRSRSNGVNLDINYGVAKTLSPWIAGEWNTIFGFFTVTPTMSASDNVLLFFNGVDGDVEFTIDDVSVTYVEETCDSNIIMHGDFEMGDNRYWNFNGINTGLQIMNNSKYGGIGYSLSTVTRNKRRDSMYQRIQNVNCLEEGKIYQISMDFRLENGMGSEQLCDPFEKYSLQISCPATFFKLTNDDQEAEYIGIGSAVGPFKIQQWNKIYGYFTMTSNIISSRKIEMINLGGFGNTDNFIIDNVVLEILNKPSRNCSQLILNGDAETGDARGWFIKGSGNKGEVSMVSGAEGSTWAFYHNSLQTKREKSFHGLWQELDQSCMAAGSSWKITAEFKIFDESGNEVSCGRNCPMFRFESITPNSKSHLSSLLENDLSRRWKIGEWNSYEATFTMTEEHKEKDYTSVFIHNVSPNYSYMVDNINIVKNTGDNLGTCDSENVVKNGDFEIGDYRDWYFMGPGDDIGINIIDKLESNAGTGYALSTLNRQVQTDTMAQDINPDCLEEGQIYEVSMDFRVGALTECEPYLNYYTISTSCLVASLRVSNSGESYISEIAWSTGPIKYEGWNRMHGYFMAMPNMVSAKKLTLFLGGAADNTNAHNIAIDNVVVKMTDQPLRTCTQLVLNGDAEVEDARFWYIKGSRDYGEITMVPGAGNSSVAFNHGSFGASRTNQFNGLWQELDQGCMEVESKWRVTAEFKIFGKEGNEVSCDKSKENGLKVCPMFRFQSLKKGVGELAYYSKPLQNKSPGEWKLYDWNFYDAEFIMTNEHKARENISVFVHNVLPYYSYSIDNIQIVPV